MRAKGLEQAQQQAGVGIIQQGLAQAERATPWLVDAGILQGGAFAAGHSQRRVLDARSDWGQPVLDEALVVVELILDALARADFDDGQRVGCAPPCTGRARKVRAPE